MHINHLTITINDRLRYQNTTYSNIQLQKINITRKKYIGDDIDDLQGIIYVENKDTINIINTNSILLSNKRDFNKKLINHFLHTYRGT